MIFLQWVPGKKKGGKREDWLIDGLAQTMEKKMNLKAGLAPSSRANRTWHAFLYKIFFSSSHSYILLCGLLLKADTNIAEVMVCFCSGKWSALSKLFRTDAAWGKILNHMYLLPPSLLPEIGGKKVRKKEIDQHSWSLQWDSEGSSLLQVICKSQPWGLLEFILQIPCSCIICGGVVEQPVGKGTGKGRNAPDSHDPFKIKNCFNLRNC